MLNHKKQYRETRRTTLAKYEKSPQVYEVANEFRVRCLEQSGSLLWDRFNIWTVDNLKLIQTHFLDAPDMTRLDFWSKLKRQFEGLPEECFMILSDALVFYSLPSLTMNRKTKMSFLDRVHEIGGPKPPELDERVTRALEQGLIQTTFRYHAKYMDIWLLIRFALRLKESAAEEILTDPWDTARFLDECLYSFRPVDRAYEMRHVLLHLLFPDVFESVISTRHKTQIVDAFLPSSEIEAAKREYSSETQSLIALDHLLLKVRQRLQLENPGFVVDLYSPDIEKRWRKGKKQEHPNYWVFQVDPRVYRAVDSLRDGKLKTIPIMAHEEDVKSGDKGVIWVADTEPGCYALVTISSDPYLGHADEVESSYYADPEGALEETTRCEVSVDFLLVDKPVLKDQVMQSPLLKDLPVGSAEAVFAITAEQYEEVRRLAHTDTPPRGPQLASMNPEYTLAQMSAETGFPEDELARWVRAIDRKGQAVFYGPPGTGKTFMAMKLARHLIGGSDGFTEIVQFHPAYSYEDFIQGIRVKTSEDGRLLYPMEPGRFLQFCAEAQRRSGRCVLVIDEINRANLSRVFGELMYLLEYRDREVPLAGDGRPFSIPANVRIIGTMNTADRSIALVDHALRRRFAFIPLRPELEILRKYHSRTGFPIENLINVLSRLNTRIGDPNFKVGISFFMRENLAQELGDIWEMEIEPYLEEYFFDQPGIVDELRWKKVKGEILP